MPSYVVYTDINNRIFQMNYAVSRRSSPTSNYPGQKENLSALDNFIRGNPVNGFKTRGLF